MKSPKKKKKLHSTKQATLKIYAKEATALNPQKKLALSNFSPLPEPIGVEMKKTKC